MITEAELLADPIGELVVAFRAPHDTRAVMQWFLDRSEGGTIPVQVILNKAWQESKLSTAMVELLRIADENLPLRTIIAFAAPLTRTEEVAAQEMRKLYKAPNIKRMLNLTETPNDPPCE